MGTLNLLVLLSCILTTLPLTIAQICSNNFTANSTYGINRNLILSSLPYNVTANGGFYTATVTQQDSETIYALALCRGDLTNQSCSYCVNTSSQEIMTNCPNQKDVLDWGYTSECIVRSSNESFFASSDTGPVRVVFGGNITDYVDEFDNTLDDLVNELISRAAEGNSSLKFATGEDNYTQYQYANIVYGLMQCIPGLSPVDCTSCLRAAVAIYQNGLLGRGEVTVMTPSCIFQYALSPFVESSVGDAPPPSPPPPPVTFAPPPPSPGKDDNTTRTVIIIVLSTIGSVIGFIVCVCTFQRKRKQKNPKQKDEAEDQISSVEFLRYDFETISIATDNFSNANKLGQGGFGVVYKGRLLNGREIAVKRLAEESQQGEIEFKNEAMLVAKLQHRNLVRLLGFCSERTERLLIYEFVPQLSLDKFIFDPNRRKLLGWDRRYKIIGGISRGLLYLHEESRLRIIHRDLKASNVLLDDDMNPKISDFGMARLVVVDETHGSTRRIVGTTGYMAPEYAVYGRFSDKSDVFSFGVLLLEILSGQKNNSIHNGVEGLLNYAWKTWRDGTTQNLIDPTLRVNSGSMQEMIKCIHIGLQCVQENVAERPNMDSVVRMLSTSISSLSYPVLSGPEIFLHSGCNNSELPLLQEHSSKLNVSGHSINEVSTADLYPR